ncbi:MAG: hypothetical protein ACOCW4_02405 [bacterium]
MGKIYIILISLGLYFFSPGHTVAQCPEAGQVKAQASNTQSFREGSGVLTFTIDSQASFKWQNYRIRLWDESKQTYVYDDNAPSFLNVTSAKVSGNAIRFDQLPEGKYSLELHGCGCEYTRFSVSSSPGTLSN